VADPGTTLNSYPQSRFDTTPAQRAAFYRDYITSKYPGMDPNIAIGVAGAEGLHTGGIGASTVDVEHGQPFSFGDFQMNIHPGALGDQALKAGYDPRNPNQWQDVGKFAIDQMYGGKGGLNLAPWKGDAYASAYLKSGKAPGTDLSGGVAGKPTGIAGAITSLTAGSGDTGQGPSPIQDLQKTLGGGAGGGGAANAPPGQADLQGQMAAGFGPGAMRQQQIAQQAQQMMAAYQQRAMQQPRGPQQVGTHLAYGPSGQLLPMADPTTTPGTTLNSTGGLYG
jgi:hypothetical protein